VPCPHSPSCGTRVLDGVIIKGGEFRVARQSEVSVEGKDIIVVHTTKIETRLRMHTANCENKNGTAILIA